MPRQITSIRSLQVGDRFRTMNGETTYVMTKRVSRHRGRIAKSEVSHKYFGFRREGLPVYLLEKARTMFTNSVKDVRQKPPSQMFSALAKGDYFLGIDTKTLYMKINHTQGVNVMTGDTLEFLTYSSVEKVFVKVEIHA